MILTGENQSTQRSTYSGATLSTTDLKQTGLGLNLSLYGEILATNPLSHGTALCIVQHPSSWNSQNTTLKPDYVM